MGGSNCESPAGEEIIRHVDDIDFVFSGPGTLSMSQFVDAHLHHRLDDRHRIDGVFSRLNCGLTDAANPATRFLTVRPIAHDLDIDEPYALDYDSYFADLDRMFPDYDVTSVIPFQTSRGCWWGEKSHCTFCGLNGKTMAFRLMKAARRSRRSSRSTSTSTGRRCCCGPTASWTRRQITQMCSRT